MRLRLTDPAYAERLVAYLRSVGQEPEARGPDVLELEAERAELEVYLRVWEVLHPEAGVEIVG